MQNSRWFYDQPPVKNPGCCTSDSLVDNIPMCRHSSLLKELNASCVTSLGGESQKLVPGFPLGLSHGTFSLVNFDSYPFEVIIVVSTTDMPSPVS